VSRHVENAGAEHGDGPSGFAEGSWGRSSSLPLGVALQLAPHPPLLAPVKDSGDRPNHVLEDRIATVVGAGQEENLLLDVGGDLKQVHDLGHTRAADVAEPGNLGLVGDLSSLDQAVEADGQGHQARDTRDSACRRGLGFRRRAFVDDLAAVAPSSEMDLALNRQALHAMTSCWLSSSASVLMPVGWKVIDTVPLGPS